MNRYLNCRNENCMHRKSLFISSLILKKNSIKKFDFSQVSYLIILTTKILSDIIFIV